MGGLAARRRCACACRVLGAHARVFFEGASPAQMGMAGLTLGGGLLCSGWARVMGNICTWRVAHLQQPLQLGILCTYFQRPEHCGRLRIALGCPGACPYAATYSMAV